MTDWRAEAERLRAELSVANSRAEQYMAERNVAQLQAQREVGETMRKLREKRDHASSLFESMASRHARLAAWARETLPEVLREQFFGVLANGAPDWKTAPRNLAVDLLTMTAERDELAAKYDELLASQPTCDWPGKCKHQLTSHRKKN